jgi:hypothetical protein
VPSGISVITVGSTVQINRSRLSSVYLNYLSRISGHAASWCQNNLQHFTLLSEVGFSEGRRTCNISQYVTLLQLHSNLACCIELCKGSKSTWSGSQANQGVNRAEPFLYPGHFTRQGYVRFGHRLTSWYYPQQLSCGAGMFVVLWQCLLHA